MYQSTLRANYSSFEEFEAYDQGYNLAERLGFESAQEAWEANPVIQGSVNPEDFKVIGDGYCTIRKDLVRQGDSVPLMDVPEESQTDSTEAVYISGGAKRIYRWLRDTEGFQIKYKGKWKFAYSIDFDF
jgi:hypothetical protein